MNNSEFESYMVPFELPIYEHTDNRESGELLKLLRYLWSHKAQTIWTHRAVVSPPAANDLTKPQTYSKDQYRQFGIFPQQFVEGASTNEPTHSSHSFTSPTMKGAATPGTSGVSGLKGTISPWWNFNDSSIITLTTCSRILHYMFDSKNRAQANRRCLAVNQNKFKKYRNSQQEKPSFCWWTRYQTKLQILLSGVIHISWYLFMFFIGVGIVEGSNNLKS